MNALPDLEAWAIFAKVAESGSFARAAAELGVSQPTVSKAIARLERRLGVALVHRTSRRMSLTGSGEAALARASRLLAEGEAVEAEATEQAKTLRGPIRMTAPMSFGVRHLAPVLPGFMALHPEVTLDVHFSDALVDLVAGGVDLALRISTLADSSLLARRLCVVRRLLVGAPAYFARFGTPSHPRELAAHRALRYVHAAAGEAWHFRHPRRAEVAQVVPAVLRVDNAEALMPALCAGLGLAVQPEFLARDDLDAARIRTALDDWEIPPIALWVVTPPGRARPARVAALIDFLAAQFVHAPWSDARAPARPRDAATRTAKARRAGAS